MTEAALRAVINSYIVDNQQYGITPAKLRDMTHKIVDFIMAGGAGGTSTLNLQIVTDGGFATTNKLVIGPDDLNKVEISNGGEKVSIIKGGVTFATLEASGSAGIVRLKASGSSYMGMIKGDTTLTADTAYVLPKRGGNFFIEGDGVMPTITPGTFAGSLAATPATAGFYGIRPDDRGGHFWVKTGSSIDPTSTSFCFISFSQWYPVSMKAMMEPAQDLSAKLTPGNCPFIIAANGSSIVISVPSGATMLPLTQYNFRYFVYS